MTIGLFDWIQRIFPDKGKNVPNCKNTVLIWRAELQQYDLQQ